MNLVTPPARTFFAACLLATSCIVPAVSAQSSAGLALDHRYAPSSWQTSICLPDDWQKTLVHKDGTLLYDFGGRHGGFGTRISFGPDGASMQIKQELVSARVPIVRTIRKAGTVEIVEEAFAAPPPGSKREVNASFVLERVGSQTVSTRWASPPAGSDLGFANIAVGHGQPVQYRFTCPKGGRYFVGFGLCEGYHEKPGARILDLKVEGKTARTVDLVAEKGQNQPAVFVFPAKDENGDGWVEVAVGSAEKASDKNTILNTLWIFADPVAPAETELIAATSSLRPLAHIDCSEPLMINKPARRDMLWVRLRNTGSETTTIEPGVAIETSVRVAEVDAGSAVQLGSSTTLTCTEGWSRLETSGDRHTLLFGKASLAPGAEKELAVAVDRGGDANSASSRRGLRLADVHRLRKEAQRYWEKLNLPYSHLEVPDAGVQELIDSSIRNIYQAREIKNGLPAFQVGPTCYRGLWVVDGSFLLEAVTYLGRANETRSGIKYLMSFQRPDGGFMIIDGHWKETGIVLWAIARHAQLTGDKNWLSGVWPDVERGFRFIRQMRRMAGVDTPNANLTPDGFSDGGLANKVPEYTNIYWTLAGMRAAVEAARWLGRDAQAMEWEKEYEDFLSTFRRAASRDLRKDPFGNSYLPIRMNFDEKIPPQKAQWAFLHAVFPGKVFAADDPLVQGNMAMLKAVESEGLVFDTGWLKNGIWTYFGSFYGHGWLWLGDGEKAARTLYAFGNHSSRLLVWREEQMPVGNGDRVVGDMPHNWASAEFIRLVRHCLVLERGTDLNLLEGMPAAWAKPGAVTRVKDIATSFGPLSFDLRIAADGKRAELKLSPPKRTRPKRIVLHLDNWSGRSGTIILKPDARTCSVELPGKHR